jgi:hypothetical protein
LTISIASLPNGACQHLVIGLDQFRSEFFNVFNRVKFFQPTPQLNFGTFGRPTATFAARQIQLALKVIF